MPGRQRDVDVPQYYVWGTDDSAIQALYWVLDSTRDDLEVAGPMPLDAARVLVEELNAAALANEPVLVVVAVAPLTPEDDRPEVGKVYQLAGAPGDPCLLNTGTALPWLRRTVVFWRGSWKP